MTEKVKGDDSFVVEPQLFEQESQNYDIVTFAVYYFLTLGENKADKTCMWLKL